MPDQRSVMKEYRFLDEKRLSQGLTPAEQARLEKLRVLVGPELGAGSIKPGFDVNAAAAALRESLLPAGLRNRPPPTPVQAPPPEPAPEPAEPFLGDALASEYAESPFAPLDAEAAEQPHDPLFDPASLGAEPPPYDPAAPGYDPNADPADPSAAYPADAASDPSAQQAWDPNQPWDPNAAAEGAQPYDPNAYSADAAYDPNAQPAWDPNQPWDPNATAEGAQPYDPNAYPADAAYDPNAQPAWDPNVTAEAPQPHDPNADPADAAADPNAQPGWDPNQAWDPNAAPPEGASVEIGAYADAAYAGAAQALDAGVAPEASAELAEATPVEDDTTHLSADELTEVEPLPGDAAPPEGGSFTAGDEGAAAGWETEPGQPAAPADAAFGAYDAGVEPFAPGTLGAEPPVDASVFGAADAGAPEQPAAPELGEYDDTAGFGAEPFDASAVPADAPDLEVGPAPELDASWPEAALDGGFEQASGGSFGAGADAAAPEWAQSPAPPPWEGTPPLDLEAAPAELAPQGAGDAAEYEISPPPASETFGTLPSSGSELFGAPEGDLAAPEEAPLAEASGAAPELDFSQPDLSGPDEDAGLGSPEGGADLGASFAASATLPPEPALGGEAPPLELGASPPADAAEPSWDASPDQDLAAAADTFATAEAELGTAPGPGEEPVGEAGPDGLADAGALASAELAEPAESEPEMLETSEVLEMEEAAAAEPLAEAAPEIAPAEPEVAPAAADFAEAAAAAVASESTDLADVIEAPPAAADDLSFDVAEEPPQAPLAEPAAFDASLAEAAAPAELGAPPPGDAASAAAPLEPLPPEPPADLSFDVGDGTAAPEQPAGAHLLEAALESAAPVAAGPAEEEIPTIDGADLLEEVIEDVPAPPPQSLDFEPLEAEALLTDAAATASAPPVVLASPPPAVVAPPPPAPPAPATVAVARPPSAPVVVAPAAPAPPPAVLAPPPPAAAAPAPAAAPGAPPLDYRIAGSHRVVVHTVEGLVKRGALEDPALDAPALPLAAQPGGPEEVVPTEKVKAIFFMLSPGEKAPVPEGKRVRVTFRDGRQIAGFSPDYREEGIGFFMIPADTKTNTGRIWVYRAAVRQVAVS